jgi:hypothetical protein
MSLFFGYTVPGLFNESERFRALLERLPTDSEVRRVINSAFDFAADAYKNQAVCVLHLLYSSCRRNPQFQGPRQVCLIYTYTENVLPLTEVGVREWKVHASSLLHHFVDPPEGNRSTRNARGISLTFLE